MRRCLTLFFAMAMISGCGGDGGSGESASPCDPAVDAERCLGSAVRQQCSADSLKWESIETCLDEAACINFAPSLTACVVLEPGKCTSDSDCVGGTCTDVSSIGVGTCLFAHCNDTKLSGDESYIDCGGSCPIKCENSRPCNELSDCESGCCNTGGVCAETSQCPELDAESDVAGADVAYVDDSYDDSWPADAGPCYPDVCPDDTAVSGEDLGPTEPDVLIDPCESDPCAKAPGPHCGEDGSVITYEDGGTCSSDAVGNPWCEWAKTSTPCGEGEACSSGSCQEIPGVCENETDLSLLNSPGFVEQSRSIALACFQECIASVSSGESCACLEAGFVSLGMSEACGNCYGEYHLCIYGKCMGQCILPWTTDPDPPGCNSCIEDNGCNAGLVACAGID
jgi:hypothetical protein